MRTARQMIARVFLVCVAWGIGTAAYAADDLAGVPEETIAEFMAGEVLDVEDLAEGAEIQRRMFNRITPPGITWLQRMFPTVVPFDAAYFDEAFLADLLGEDRNSVAVYPLSLALDPRTHETLIYNAGGKLIATLSADKASRVWPEDADPVRVTLQLNLLPVEDVEPYLYVESRVAESLAARVSAKSPRTGGLARRGLGGSEFGICDIQHLTNGNVRLTVTNGTDVVELYAYSVAHTSSAVVISNETFMLWTAVSPSFNGIDSEWECATTNLACTNGVGAWEDANISSNARVRFYAVAQRTDSDEDGLSDGAEIFLYRTDPENPDTDGDGAGDGDEADHGANARDPGSFPVNEALEAALADVNVAQIGYLSYLTGATFTYDPTINYAQRIQQLRDALEGMAGSFLDTDVNNGGVLAEGSNVVTWALDTVLTSAGSSSGNWLGGLASTSQVEEAVAVLGKLAYLTNVTTSSAGYLHQSVANNEEPVQIGDTWDLGTGYPDGWPTNQPIKTYLLLGTKIEIPYVGLGTVDDWIEVNGTARFPGSGEIYSSHVADITPVWNPQGANSLALWDCGDCAGDNNFAYLSPFKVVQILEVPSIIVDLDVDSDYDGYIDDEDDGIETSAGGAVGINSDDDDWDDNTDRNETCSIVGEDDLQKITLVIEPPLTPGTVKLETIYSGAGRIALWEGSNKTTAVPLTNTWNLSSGTFSSNLWIEGIAPSTNGARDVEINLSYQSGDFTCTDTVAITVCDLFFGAFGHDGQNYGWPPAVPTEYGSFTNYVLSKGAVLRGSEYVMVRPAANSFLIRIANSQGTYKAALHTEDAYVGIIAHANTGLGPAFDVDCTSLSDFFNVGTPFAAVDYQWLHATYPSFVITSGEIANGVTNYNTTELGVERFPNCAYANPPVGWPILSDVPVGGAFPTNCFLTSYEKMHFYVDDNEYSCPSIEHIALLVTAGAIDKPTLKYKKLFLNQCRSGRRFSDVMNHGVLFYNHDLHGLPTFLCYRLETYLEAILDAKNDAAIEIDLDSGPDGEIYSHKEF